MMMIAAINTIGIDMYSGGKSSATASVNDAKPTSPNPCPIIE